VHKRVKNTIIGTKGEIDPVNLKPFFFLADPSPYPPSFQKLQGTGAGSPAWSFVIGMYVETCMFKF